MAIALGLGTMVGWKRIVVTVGEKIGKTHLTYGQGAAAEIVAAATIGAADGFGLPVSTTHVLSSGVAGTMVANGSGMQWSTVRSIAMAWVLTLPAAMILSGLLFVIFRQSFDGGSSTRGAGRWVQLPPYEVDGPRANTRDADPARLHVFKREVHHRRHQRVGKGVVLIEHGQAEVVENAREPQVDLGARRRVAVFALIIGPRYFDLLVRQRNAEQAPHVLVEHRDVEFEVEADQRPRADETQEIRQHLLHGPSASDVLLAQPVHLDGVRIEPRFGPDGRLEPLARQNAVGADPDCRDRDDVVFPKAEAGRLAIDRDRFPWRRRLEQKAINGIAQEAPVQAALELQQHQNIARLKCRRSRSRSRFTIWKASRRRSRSMIDSSPGLTRLVEADSAICASRRSVIR